MALTTSVKITCMQIKKEFCWLHITTIKWFNNKTTHNKQHKTIIRKQKKIYLVSMSLTKVSEDLHAHKQAYGF